MRFKSLVPMLQTREIDETRTWYETVLGFKCVEQAEGWPTATRRRRHYVHE